MDDFWDIVKGWTEDDLASLRLKLEAAIPLMSTPEHEEMIVILKHLIALKDHDH